MKPQKGATRAAALFFFALSVLLHSYQIIDITRVRAYTCVIGAILIFSVI